MSDPPFDLSQIMQQAQQLQERMQRAQEELRHREVEATVGGGMVTARANGRMQLIKLEIDPQAVDARDVEMLQDLIIAAVNQVMTRAQEMVQQELQSVTGGLPIANLFSGLGRGE
jgi:DNA-binding YbaB/EbfC family protein